MKLKKALACIVSTTIICVTVIGSSLTLNATADTTNVKTGSATLGGSAIDGLNTKGEWDGITSYPIDQFKQNTGIAGDTKGTFKLKWDKNKLYALVDVQDSTVSHTGGLDAQDSIQVYIDYGNQEHTTYKGDDYQFEITRNGTIGFSDCQDYDLANNLTKSIVDTATGYTVEFALDMTTISGDAPQIAGQTIGIDFQINDCTTGSPDRIAAYGWADNQDKAWSDPSVLGKITFVDPNIINSSSSSQPNNSSSSQLNNSSSNSNITSSSKINSSSSNNSSNNNTVSKNNQSTSNPKTGDNMIGSLITAALLSGMCSLIILKKKKNS